MTSTHASAAQVRRAYANQAAISYSFYMVGAAAAFIAVALELSETETGLHSSAMALGIVVSGLTGERVDGRLGVRRAHLAAMGLLAVSLLLLASASALWATLGGALGIGLGSGMMFVHVNSTLGMGGGVIARVQLARASLVAKAAQLPVPLIIAVGTALAIGWPFVIVPLLLLLGVIVVMSRKPGEEVPSHDEAGRLPWAYWLPWMMTVSIISMEFCIVFWGSTIVGRQTGVSLEDATLTISAFIVGMMAGRTVLSFHAMGRLDPMRVIRFGAFVTIVAVLVPWLSGELLVSGAGMMAAGVGIGIQFPPAASITLGAVPGRATAAASRLTLAAGVAILVAPFLLGVLADLVGITAGWLLVPLICAWVIVLTVPVERARRARRARGAGAG